MAETLRHQAANKGWPQNTKHINNNKKKKHDTGTYYIHTAENQRLQDHFKRSVGSWVEKLRMEEQV